MMSAKISVNWMAVQALLGERGLLVDDQFEQEVHQPQEDPQAPVLQHPPHVVFVAPVDPPRRVVQRVGHLKQEAAEADAT